MVKKISLLLFVCFSFSAFAQQKVNIKGIVIDAKTGKKLAGADIILKNTYIGTSSNAKGDFIISGVLEGKYTLEISFMGYQTQVKRIEVIKGRKYQFTIKLKQQSENLEEVIISAKTKARELREQSMPVSIITMSQLQGTVNSISDILNKTVGVTLRSSGGVGSATRLSIRGLEGKRIGFFIEDIPVTDQSDFIDINDIPVDMIERIEIYKGVVPAKFGGSAMGGAVNIVIKEYPSRYADISYTRESFNVNKIQAVFKRNLKSKGILFGAGTSYTYADNNYVMESPYIKGLKIKRNHNKFKKIMIGSSIKATKWWFDKIEFEPVFLSTYNEIQGIESDIREAHMSSQAYILSNALEKNNFFVDGLDFDMSTIVAYTKYSLVDKAQKWYDWDGKAYNPQSPLGGELGNRYASDSDNRKVTLMHKLNLEYLFNEQHSVNINSLFTLANGYPKDELKDLSYHKKMVFDSKMRSWVAGISYDFNTKDDKFLNSLTTRYYYYKMNTRRASPYGIGDNSPVNLQKHDFGISDAMRYRFSSTLMAKLSLGYDVRIPSEAELLGNGSFIIPAEDLVPERNTSLNAGLLYDLTGRHSSNLQIELGGFYMYLQDMIRYTSSFVGAQYQNFGESRTLGVEFEIKSDIFPFLYGYFNATYQDLRDVRNFEENSTVANPTKGKRMPNIPYFLTNVGLEFHKENLFGGTGQNTRIFADASFIEEYFYDFEMTKYNQRRIPRSLTFDVGFEHSFLNQKVFLSGKIKNLTDAKVLSEFNRPLPGRSFGVKLRYVMK